MGMHTWRCTHRILFVLNRTCSTYRQGGATAEQRHGMPLHAAVSNQPTTVQSKVQPSNHAFWVWSTSCSNRKHQPSYTMPQPWGPTHSAIRVLYNKPAVSNLSVFC
jgi:hypothetical protein